MKLKLLPTFVSAFLIGAMGLSAQSVIDPGLTGNTASSTWTNLNPAAYPNVPNPAYNPELPPGPNNRETISAAGSGGWSTSLLSNINDNTSGISINKVGGQAQIAGNNAASYLYTGQSGVSQLKFTSTAPLDDLATLAFQYSLTSTPEGVDFLTSPVLNIVVGGASIGVTESVHHLLYTHTTVANVGGQDRVTVANVELYQWDLSAYAGTIESFTVDWSVESHTMIGEMRFDQSDIYTEAIPEPSTYALVALTGLGAMLVRRVRRSAA